MSNRHTLEKRLIEAWPAEVWQNVTVGVAVSGGADSVALLRALAAIRGQNPDRLVVLHFNHQLRGDDSDADQQFVVDLCRRLGVECVIGRADECPTAAGQTAESGLRDKRYRFLVSASEQLGARYLATAHTADDQVETVLHRIIRGTGLAGLGGIPPVRPLSDALTLVRPMLSLWRTDVLQYLRAIGQSHREDRTNRDIRRTRNRIRHDLLPELTARYNSSVHQAIFRLGQFASEAQRLIQSQTDYLVDDSVRLEDGSTVRVDCDKLSGRSSYLVREVFVTVWCRQNWPRRAMGFEHWQILASLVMGEKGYQSTSSASLPGNVFAQRVGNELVLTRSQTT